jgi:hypothetical protein
MRTLTKALLPAAVIGIAISAYSCGAGVSTGVYVGVAVPGPYVGYPGVGYPGYVGRPPYVYEEDAFNLPAKTADRVAASDSKAQAGQWCEPDSGASVACAAREPERSATESADESPFPSDRAGSLRR